MRIDDAFSLNIRSRFLIRTQFQRPRTSDDAQRDPEPWTQQTSIATARLWFSGHVGTPRLTWLTQLAVAERDFRDGATSPIYDAYIDYEAHPQLSLRAGQFFVPFDRLRTVREWALQLGERPRPVQEFTLDRDVGIVAYSDHAGAPNSPLAWKIGMFSGGGIHRFDQREPGALLVARVELRPLGDIDDDVEGDLARRTRPALAIGAGYARHINSDRVRGTTGTLTTATFDVHHFAADLVFKWNGLALQLAWLHKQADEVSQQSTTEDDTAETIFSRDGSGWVSQLSWLLPVPLEFVGRVSRIEAAAGTEDSWVTSAEDTGLEVGAGANWYFNGHKMKLQSGWLARSAATGASEGVDHNVYLQFDITF
jgi:hypothetical protein